MTGRIKSVTFPTGGQIQYQYTGAHNGIICTDGSAAGLTRTLTPGGAWTYARSGTAPHWITTISDPTTPTANQTVIDFQGIYETQRKVYQGALTGTLLKTTLTCYNGNGIATPSTCPGLSVVLPITRITGFRYTPDSTGYQAETDTSYNSSGLVTEVDNYDYGHAVVGSLVGKILTAYGAFGNSIRPVSVVVKDASNVVKASTGFSYDQTAVTTTSGTPQHVAVTVARGNLTSVANQVSGSVTLYKRFTYYDTGTLNTSTDAGITTTGGSHVTTYNYASSTASCGNSFVTSVTEPLSLSHSMTWDCNGGLMLSQTDENAKTVTFSYTDANFWKQTAVLFPDGGETDIQYNTTVLPWTITTTSKIDATHNLSKEDVLDGFGRTTGSQLLSDPAGTVFVDTTYDSNGRTAQQSPIPITPSVILRMALPLMPTMPWVVLLPLQNPEVRQFLPITRSVRYEFRMREMALHALPRSYQNDALGRLASVCEVTSTTLLGISATPSACGQDISATGFLTTYQYDALGKITNVTQGSLNPRTYVYDMLSRLTSETNPEAGTVSYSYDTGSAGDLYQRIAPKPNQTGSAMVTTTYAYDALHRLTQKSYNDGTPSANFAYDQTTAFGFTSLTNTLGKMSSAWAQSGTTTQAAEISSYDSMGRTVDNSQCVASNCSSSTTFSLYPYSYDLLGDLKTSPYGWGGYAYTFNYNTAAQVTQVTSNLVDSSHPGTLLTVNQYNALGIASQDTLGTGTSGAGITETRGFDNRGRLNSLSTTVIGGPGIYGLSSVNYAPDGDFLGAADTILGGTWAYSYDEFNRLKTTTGTTTSYSNIGFNYAYDRFGNRWQQNVTTGSGPSPSYSFDANNRIVGSSTMRLGIC